MSNSFPFSLLEGQPHRERLVAALQVGGCLRSDALTHTFLHVPREAFVSAFYQRKAEPGMIWAQNAVVTRAGIVLIDWESAGRGATIVDLADFLLRSQCDTHGASPNRLHERHLTAAVSGYARHRLPSEPELDLLVDATRFSVAWRAAWMFAQIERQGWTPRLEQGITRVQATYALAEPTACFARSAFQECGLRRKKAR